MGNNALADENLHRISERWVVDARVLSYLTGAEGCAATGGHGAIFGEMATLHAAASAPVEVGTGRLLCVTLVWEALGEIEASYKVGGYVFDAAGGLVAQYDGIPAGYLRPTTTWAPGERIVDRFAVMLPEDLPAGTYELQVALYDEASGERLPVGNGTEAVIDTFRVP